MNETIVSAKRVIFYDHLRILASFSVVMLHVAAQNFYTSDVNGVAWHSFNFYDSIVRWGVPVFVMISGSLLLNCEVNISKLYSKSILRLFTAFVSWSFIYYLFSGEGVFSQFFGLFDAGKTQRLVDIISSHYHLWFVPMIAGIYICIPVIKQIVNSEKTCKYFLLLAFVFNFLLPQINNLIIDFGGAKLKYITTAINANISNMNMNFVMNYVFYFILGYYLSKTKFSKMTRYMIYLLGIVGFAFTIIVDGFLAIKTQMPIATYYGNFCVNVLFEAIAVYELYKNIPFKEPYTSVGSKLVILMSRWSFGAYLVHALIITKLNVLYGINTLSFPFSTYLSVPLISLFVFICSYVISGILNCIPILKNYLV